MILSQQRPYLLVMHAAGIIVHVLSVHKSLLYIFVLPFKSFETNAFSINVSKVTAKTCSITRFQFQINFWELSIHKKKTEQICHRLHKYMNCYNNGFKH